MPSYSFDVMTGGKKRSAEYGSVTIDYEVLSSGTIRQLERPVLARGYICPLGSTLGRKSAPEPMSGFRIANTKKIPKKALALSERNTGRADMDKGHIFALELGGPDVPANICPQFSQLQRNGEWRQMENEAWAYAAESEHLVQMTIAIIYNSGATISRGLTPAGFLVDLYEEVGSAKMELKSYRIRNTQNNTDDMMADRLDPDIDEKSPTHEIIYGPSSSPRTFDRPVLGVRIDGQDLYMQPAMSRRASLSSGVQKQSIDLQADGGSQQVDTDMGTSK